VVLGATLLTFFGIALAVRSPLEKRFVLTAPIEDRPRCQFKLELILCIAAGLAVGVYNKLVHGFVLVSAISLLIGCVVIGFFMGLDMALARERASIHQALQENAYVRPSRLYPITRKFSLVAISTSLFICIVLVMVISRDFDWLVKSRSDPNSLIIAQRTVMIEVVFIMMVLLGIVVNLIISYSRNLKLLFNNETQVLERVSGGDLSQMVPVVTHDEFGIIAGHTNDMIQGLRHRTELINALRLADEVQQTLLPQQAISHPAAEVAGTSHYCTDTGGDYYDHFALPGGKLGIVVADSSGHGISSAIQMTNTRAYLRAGLDRYRDAAALVQQINRFLFRDNQQTGWFITLLLLEIDPQKRRLAWIRAGHEPALLYDPQSDRFGMLAGEGVALGAIREPVLTLHENNHWVPGTVIFIATDGIRETRNRAGAMFGLKRLKSVIRHHAQHPPEAIIGAVLKELEDFRESQPQEDDITMVAVKLL
jgi:sigma-B regulation protein RsbU (phosphoserine phosphatase)